MKAGQSVIVREIECKSILIKSGIKGVDYAINPYVGCGHGCLYCYAIFMKRFTGHKEEWGTFVDVKVNAAEVLARSASRRMQRPPLMKSRRASELEKPPAGFGACGRLFESRTERDRQGNRV